MKKIIACLLLAAMLLTGLTACGQTAKPEETQAPEQTTPTTETPEETKEPAVVYNPDDYAFFKTFPAPQGDYRQIAVDYMEKMSKIEWTPNETFLETMATPRSDLSVNLEYEAGKTYYGVAYSDIKANLDEFMLYVNGNVFTPNTTHYETMIGNNCSSSMVMAFQQLINLHYYGTLKPTDYRGDDIKFVGDIKKPEIEELGDNYRSEDVWETNSREVIMDAFSKLKKGDILYRSPRVGGGHTRMVYKDAVVKYKGNKEINYSTSYVEVLEQTNAWNADKTSTWWYKKYSFIELYESKFMPTTLAIYESGKPLEDAYIMLDTAITAESIVKNGLSGNVISNFPLTYVRATVKDAAGNIVKQEMLNNFGNKNEGYRIPLKKLSPNLGLVSSFENALPAGTYSFTLEAGISRGNTEIVNVTFTK